MAQNGNIGFLESVEVFGDAMGEQYMDGTPNGMFIIASDGERSIRFIDGNENTLLDALSTLLFSDESLFELFQDAMALAVVARLKEGKNDDNDD